MWMRFINSYSAFSHKLSPYQYIRHS